MTDLLHHLVLAKLREPVVGAGEISDDVRRGRADGCARAVLLYGSTLASATRAPSSIHDVYVVAESLRRFHGRRLHAALNAFLPPNVYYRSFVRDGAAFRYKLCVIAAGQLLRETSPAARDLHHLGRFSKRMALAWARDDDAAREIAAAQASALRALAPHARARLPEHFALDEFALALLGLSYAGETRVAEDDKVAALFRAEPDYYREAFELLLREQPDVARTGDAYAQPPPDDAARRATARLLTRSRRRERLRWPKYIVTFDNWLDYLLDKLERHHGIRLDLTARERRWPLIFAWPKYFALRRRGIVK